MKTSLYLATAIYKNSPTKPELKKWINLLNSITILLTDDQIETYLTSPAIKPSSKTSLINNLLLSQDNTPISSKKLTFIEVLIASNSINIVKEISKELTIMENIRECYASANTPRTSPKKNRKQTNKG